MTFLGPHIDLHTCEPGASGGVGLVGRSLRGGEVELLLLQLLHHSHITVQGRSLEVEQLLLALFPATTRARCSPIAGGRSMTSSSLPLLLFFLRTIEVTTAGTQPFTLMIFTGSMWRAMIGVDPWNGGV